jgi:hypothetical protein
MSLKNRLMKLFTLRCRDSLARQAQLKTAVRGGRLLRMEWLENRALLTVIQPTLDHSVYPTSLIEGTTGNVLDLTGTNFADGATVYWTGYPSFTPQALTTHFISSTELKADLPDAYAAEEGSNTVVVQSPDAPFGSGEGTSNSETVNVAESLPVIRIFRPAPFRAGDTVTFNGEIDDTDVADSHRVIIEWGDGTVNQLVPVAANGLVTRPFTVQHVYDTAGFRTFHAIAFDQNDTLSRNEVIFVFDVPPPLPPTFAVNVDPVTSIQENDSATISGSFNDPLSSGTHDVFINWADGSSPYFTRLDPGVTSFSGSHLYQDNRPNDAPYAATVTVVGTVVGFATASVAVTNVAPTLAAPADQTAIEGASALIALGSFSDPGVNDAPWTVNVNWGDNTSSTFTTLIQGSLGSLSHPYAEEGTYTPTVTVTDKDHGISNIKTFQINVSDPSVIPTGGFNITGSEGSSTGNKTVATFTDPGGVEPLSAYSAIINWGDSGSPSLGTISVTGGIFTVTGSHTYADNGNYPVVTTISHESSVPQNASSTALIANVAPTASISSLLPSLAVPGQTISLAGAFTDLGKLDTHTAMIDWDYAANPGLTTSPGNVSELVGSGTGTVAGSHIYTTLGNHTVQLIVTDKDGASSVVATAIVNIQTVALEPDPCDPTNTALVVGGTIAADKIEIKLGSANHPGKYTVNLTIAGVLSTTTGDTGTPTSRVIAYGLDGNDEIKIDTHGRTVPAWLFGGAGDDKIAGNIGNDVLDGGEGADLLLSNGGRDMLIGGVAGDVLDAGKGEDILIGGTLDYDDYIGALCKIMDAWGSSANFTIRKNTLLDSSTPDSINLVAHVHNDNAFDDLKSGSGSDWFLANTIASTSDTTIDKLEGIKVGVDEVTDINAV